MVEQETSSAPPNIYREQDDYLRATKELENLSRQAGLYSDLVMVSTILNFMGFVLVALFLKIKLFPIYEANAGLQIILFLASPAILVFAVSSIAIFDRIGSIGNAYYQEISDNFEWADAGKDSRIYARIRLKKFLVSSALPFVKGRNGSAFYVLINVLMSMGTVLSLLVSR